MPAHRVLARVRRAAGSGLGTVLALMLLVGLGVSALFAVQGQQRQQRDRFAVSQAVIIAQATAARVLSQQNLHRPLTVSEQTDLTGDVAQLRRGGHLLGLSAARLDGELVFSSGVIPAIPRADLLTAGRRSTAVHYAQARSGGSGASVVDVAIPLDVDDEGPAEFVVYLAIPSASLTSATSRSSIEIVVAIGLVLLVVSAGVLGLRRRLRLRERTVVLDSLTGLGNRLLLEREATDLLAQGSTVALLLMDLDGFKRVNDTLGHRAGDELLQLLGADLGQVVRRDDILVRLGGDEFALLLRDVGEAEALAAGARMLGVLERTYVVRDVTLRVEGSIGVALSGALAGTVGALLQAADIAMYRAKRGKLGLWLYGPQDAAAEGRELELLIDLRQAVEGGGLHLAYQPAMSLRPGVTPFVEALARWDHPVHGPIPPDRFIRIAEDTALIHQLTAWVLDEAVGQCARWHQDGLDVVVAVNVSSHSLTYPGLVTLVVDTLARHRLPASALHLEITETAIVARPDMAARILTELTDRGIALSMDDFGAGFTSLAQLQTTPVSSLKIDKQFVQHLTERPGDASIVGAVIAVAHGLGMLAVAEGVEDLATLQRLEALGCDIAQGYYVSRPVTPESATRWLRDASARTQETTGRR